MAYIFFFFKALQMNVGEKKEGRQLIFAKHLLRADWFIHILMYSLHDNPAISFSLQIKKPRLRKVQSSVCGHTGAKW